MVIDINDIGKKFIDYLGRKCEIKDVDNVYDEITIEFFDDDVDDYVYTTITTEIFLDDFQKWINE